jgi:phosphoglycolate phosphatase
MLNFQKKFEPFKVIIFDCDGVLFDSRRANQFFYNHLLNHFGKMAMTEKDLEFVHMHTVHEAIDYLFEQDSDREKVHDYRQVLDYTPFLQRMEMEQGLISFLELIRPWVKTAISTSRTNTIGPVLNVFGLTGYFDMVVSALDVSRPKPDPESIFKIMNHFKVGPERCLFIGDSEVDSQTALNAGVPLVAYKNKKISAYLHVQSFDELAGHLGRK